MIYANSKLWCSYQQSASGGKIRVNIYSTTYNAVVFQAHKYHFHGWISVTVVCNIKLQCCLYMKMDLHIIFLQGQSSYILCIDLDFGVIDSDHQCKQKRPPLLHSVVHEDWPSLQWKDAKMWFKSFREGTHCVKVCQ